VAIFGRPLSVELAPEPAEVTDGGSPLDVGFAVEARRAGVLRCEVSLWCALLDPEGRPDPDMAAEIARHDLEVGPVGSGRHELRAQVELPAVLRPTVRTPDGGVAYDLNVVARIDDRHAVDRRRITVRSVATDPWIETEVGGDGPWGLVVEAAPARPGGPLEGVVRIEPEADGTLRVDARLERFEEGPGAPLSPQWSQELPVADDVAVVAGQGVELPLRFDLPDDAVPTVVTARFAERWRLTVTARDGERVRQVVTGAVVLA
jgi:hypothetical protein